MLAYQVGQLLAMALDFFLARALCGSICLLAHRALQHERDKAEMADDCAQHAMALAWPDESCLLTCQVWATNTDAASNCMVRR